jgi:phenylpropionate dioxygenase-like ring-hydroxylating dioxygenase large terminal subunit
MWLHNCWQVAAFSSELSFGALLARQICDQKIVFYRDGTGRPIALEDRCPHRLAPLSRGRLAGDDVVCGYHGLRFGPNGKCVGIPGRARIPPKACVRAYPVVERYRCLWIWLGEPGAADDSLVPDVSWLERPDWACALGYHHIRANYKLLNDNLLDLSHETYVHGKTIGNDAVAESAVVVRADGRGVYVDKEIERCHAPPFYQYLANVSATDEVRRWQRTTYHPPGYIVIDVGVEPISIVRGALRAEGRVIDLITPETSSSTHYFWAFARNFRLDEPAVTEFTRENVARTFDEDKEMLEAQQQNIGAIDKPPFQVALRADAGPTQGRRLLAAMIAAEQQRLAPEPSAPSAA